MAACDLDDCVRAVSFEIEPMPKHTIKMMVTSVGKYFKYSVMKAFANQKMIQEVLMSNTMETGMSKCITRIVSAPATNTSNSNETTGKSFYEWTNATVNPIHALSMMNPIYRETGMVGSGLAAAIIIYTLSQVPQAIFKLSSAPDVIEYCAEQVMAALYVAFSIPPMQNVKQQVVDAQYIVACIDAGAQNAINNGINAGYVEHFKTTLKNILYTECNNTAQQYIKISGWISSIEKLSESYKQATCANISTPSTWSLIQQICQQEELIHNQIGDVQIPTMWKSIKDGVSSKVVLQQVLTGVTQPVGITPQQMGYQLPQMSGQMSAYY